MKIINKKKPFLDNKNSFLPDFGLYFQSSFGGNRNSTFILTESFVVGTFVMYPNETSSITGKVGDRAVTFDFDDEVLKVFIHIFTNLNVVDRTDLERKIREQHDQPIVIRFYQSPILVNGMVLTCKFGKVQKSAITDEEFLPLVIESADIVQEPAAILI